MEAYNLFKKNKTIIEVPVDSEAHYTPEEISLNLVKVWGSSINFKAS